MQVSTCLNRKEAIIMRCHRCHGCLAHETDDTLKCLNCSARIYTAPVKPEFSPTIERLLDQAMREVKL